MTSVREDLGFLPREPKFRKPPPQAEYVGVRDLGDEGWEAEVRKANGKAVWLMAATKNEAVNRGRNLVAALNAGRTVK